MRYTRYDYKKKKKNSTGKFILSMILTIFSTIIIGTGIAWVAAEIIPFNNVASSDINDETEDLTGESPPVSEGEVVEELDDEEGVEQASTEVSTNDINTNFTMVQCGVFSSEENANQLLVNISSETDGFIVKDEELYRVFAGVYAVEEAEGVVNNLDVKDIDSVKVNYSLDANDEVETQIAAIVNGYLDILRNTSDEEVKSVNTTKFKEWVESLDIISEGENFEKLNTIKEYIKVLPEEIEKGNISNEMGYLYTILEGI